jgi:[ribosomal protein S18]-alanine N-acetyltransferase
MMQIRPVRVRPIIEKDLALVRAWMREAPEAPRWNEDDLAAVLRTPLEGERKLRRGWVAEDAEAGLAGFVVATALCISGHRAECELEFVLVKPEARKRGIGGMLVQAVAEWACSLEANEIRLEVRESNARARRLYERCGFAVVGRRPGYYADPTEDAVLLRCVVGD